MWLAHAMIALKYIIAVVSDVVVCVGYFGPVVERLRTSLWVYPVVPIVITIGIYRGPVVISGFEVLIA